MSDNPTVEEIINRIPTGSKQIYVLDANVFITAKNSYYAFNIAPGFWNALVFYTSKGRIRSIDRIKKQVEEYHDELADWINAGNMAEAFVDSNTPEIVQAYKDIMNWVENNRQFTNAAKEAYANDPDGWLIAYVKANAGCVLVTLEVFDPNIRWKIPIPNISKAFGVKYINTFEMLKQLEVKLT